MIKSYYLSQLFGAAPTPYYSEMDESGEVNAAHLLLILQVFQKPAP